jgi:hypothetical protein
MDKSLYCHYKWILLIVLQLISNKHNLNVIQILTLNMLTINVNVLNHIKVNYVKTVRLDITQLNQVINIQYVY